MPTFPKEQKFEIDNNLATLLLAGQTVNINDNDFVVRYITLKQGTYDKILVAAPIPRLRLTEIEEK